jgi:hypothetical protein
MDRETCHEALVRLLAGLKVADGDRVPANCLYPPAGWSDAAVRADLWGRACAAAERGALTQRDVALWGHWHRLSGGPAWPRTEIRRRLGVGRGAAASEAARVDAAVAASLASDPPAAAPAADLRVARGADWEDAAAVALGRAVLERHPHREEIRYALHDLCRTAHPTATGLRRLPSGTAPRKRNLKTSRHRSSARVVLHRAVVEARLRAAGSTVRGPGRAALPLWEDGPPHTEELEQVLSELRTRVPSQDREAQVRLLRDGHRHLLRHDNEPDLVRDFLFLESAILGAHLNIGCVAILDLLEDYLDPCDPRRVATAQARELILERHHYWSAARTWADRVWQRLGEAGIRWASPDHKRRAVARALERRTSLEAKRVSVSLTLDPAALQRMARRTRHAAERLAGSAGGGEFALIARRRSLQARWATKNRDRLLGLPARWDDEELAELEEIDAAAARVTAPTGVLSWHNQKLGVLLSAERPDEFLRAAWSVVPGLRTEGPRWPAQVSAARVTLDLALRRRSRAWRAVREELAEIASVLPEHTDDTLRNPYAIPRELVVNGVAIR